MENKETKNEYLRFIEETFFKRTKIEFFVCLNFISVWSFYSVQNIEAKKLGFFVPNNQFLGFLWQSISEGKYYYAIILLLIATGLGRMLEVTRLFAFFHSLGEAIGRKVNNWITWINKICIYNKGPAKIYLKKSFIYENSEIFKALHGNRDIFILSVTIYPKRNPLEDIIRGEYMISKSNIFEINRGKNPWGIIQNIGKRKKEMLLSSENLIKHYFVKEYHNFENITKETVTQYATDNLKNFIMENLLNEIQEYKNFKSLDNILKKMDSMNYINETFRVEIYQFSLMGEFQKRINQIFKNEHQFWGYKSESSHFQNSVYSNLFQTILQMQSSFIDNKEIILITPTVKKKALI